MRALFLPNEGSFPDLSTPPGGIMRIQLLSHKRSPLDTLAGGVRLVRTLSLPGNPGYRCLHTGGDRP
ncbi:MAG: hypothetical protein BWY93_00277 [Euryarchaeota archaeon ADurb.BinA087]|nr:MAG: hypothetical protein BWY93_00277 [Euryarchaeota archaeon ADurb.BinA087]HQA79976.1 hypothetical protein [Methanoregulaceae archaeon]